MIARRRSLGIDLFDEVWVGEYHMAPAPHPAHGFVERQLAVALAPYADAQGLVGTGPFNLGAKDDYRVPDGGYHQHLPNTVFVATALVLVEVVSPDDETYAKLAFYGSHGVQEIIVADPARRSLQLFQLAADGSYHDAERSASLAIDLEALQAIIDWPDLG
mgnify:CR=1 FL=1